MNAHARKNIGSELELMSPVAGKVTEAVLLLMQYFGLQKIEVRKLKGAEFERIVAMSSNFEGTPFKIIEHSFLVKDILAQLLASVGVINLEIEASEEEKEKLLEGYLQLEELYNSHKYNEESSSEEKADTPAIEIDKSADGNPSRE